MIRSAGAMLFAVPTSGGPDDEHLLDNAVWWASTSHQANLALGSGRARRFHPAVSVFGALETPDEDAWHDLATATGADPVALFRTRIGVVPAGWETLARGRGHQLVLDPGSLRETAAPTSRELTTHDVPAMLELVALTTPGPFLPRTIEMGRYHGSFDGDRLVAMAGERAHLPGHTEISAVCTHPGRAARAWRRR